MKSKIIGSHFWYLESLRLDSFLADVSTNDSYLINMLLCVKHYVPLVSTHLVLMKYIPQMRKLCCRILWPLNLGQANSEWWIQGLGRFDVGPIVLIIMLYYCIQIVIYSVRLVFVESPPTPHWLL